VLVVIAGGLTGYLIKAHHDQQSAGGSGPAIATTDLSAIAGRPRIVFRSESRAHFGRLAMVALDDPAGPRAITPTACERVYASRVNVVCLELNHLSVLYRARVLDATLHTVQTLPLSGSPSRARLSADGRLAATTAFTSVGDSYATADFSTRTYVSTVGSDSRSTSLEDFALIRDGRRISPVDRNFWGVTYAADDNTFYATVGFDGHTWLVRGDLSARTVTTLRPDAECPSLSPDGRHLVYKKRLDRPRGRWRLTALDLRTGTETRLAETRSVDDQVEWLDDDRVMYAIPQTGNNAAISDIYAVAADGTGAPTILIREASSPSVVR
jgi:Tol biopolymer transport system component